jgi:hypothetical protein
VDGATLITDKFELMAFGAKLVRRRGSPPCERVVVTEPIEGSETEIVPPASLGGTRHLSAAQFVHDQRDAIALVASQDGRFTIFKWAPNRGPGARAPGGSAPHLTRLLRQVRRVRRVRLVRQVQGTC